MSGAGSGIAASVTLSEPQCPSGSRPRCSTAYLMPRRLLERSGVRGHRVTEVPVCKAWESRFLEQERRRVESRIGSGLRTAQAGCLFISRPAYRLQKQSARPVLSTGHLRRGRRRKPCVLVGVKVVTGLAVQ